jgi:hypothetical protein
MGESSMEGVSEKFTVRFTETGVNIEDTQGRGLVFTAGEALMILDILQNEEAGLRKLAAEASPLPVKIRF